MNQSFYIGALGAMGQQAKLDLVSNNIANVNTVSYKAKYSAFSDLLHYNVKSSQGGDAARSGTGVKVAEQKIDFSGVGYTPTGFENDYAIRGEGFFMLRNPATGDVTYTRDGRFQLSRLEDLYYLVDEGGRRVLNQDEEEITYKVKSFIVPGEDDFVEDEEDPIEEGERDPRKIGVFTFDRKDGIRATGENEFTASELNGDPILLENAKVEQRALETSGVDFAKEMTRMIEAQRAYSYALKMVQTSDEIEVMVNSLR